MVASDTILFGMYSLFVGAVSRDMKEDAKDDFEKTMTEFTETMAEFEAEMREFDRTMAEAKELMMEYSANETHTVETQRGGSDSVQPATSD